MEPQNSALQKNSIQTENVSQQKVFSSEQSLIAWSQTYIFSSKKLQ